ncbi:MAG TPA: AAA family ATPase [Bacteroidales bacterium]|mgnify:FL=1|nr:AAA family ATPase [Bacteroidales bacterium]MDI9573902.1 AAA family ATPase [Bacteroidota bacterium]OQC60949.1 MAG: hypothetical protein BWX51_00718 [Bacteroidetes bacterium ADurb.Bin012]MBP9512019.1 AAA family ATPase [Bacteroidales bacterium]MBP9588501.1 AAA family ATPase [Bacteroidales bacterium]
MMHIIGITGTLGAGKGTIVEYLKDKKGFAHFSVREFLKEILLMQNKPVNRDNYTLCANQLREKFGPSYIIDCLYEKALAKGCNAVIESIRTPGEFYSLRQKGNFTLFAIDADPEIRYERIKQRNSETDQITFEEFLASERREMQSDEPHHQNITLCISLADYKFLNNGTKEELFELVEETLKQMGL